MGESSKKLGEEGEAKIRAFFESIGWPALSDGFDIDCLMPEQHKAEDSSGNRRTHGIDFAYSYVCPVVTNRQRNILISAKNSAEDETPTKRMLIKKDLRELAIALKCFNHSRQKKVMNESGKGATSSEDVGILIRLNKDKDTDRSYLGDAANRDRIEIEGSCPLYLIENARFDHVSRVIRHVTTSFGGLSHSYALPKTALNFAADSRRTSSDLLPIQSLVGGPIAVRLDSPSGSEQASLVIYTDEPFEIDHFRRLTSLGLDLSSNWVNVTIAFPDFQQHAHGEVVSQAIAGMAQKDFAAKVKCCSLEERVRLI